MRNHCGWAFCRILIVEITAHGRKLYSAGLKNDWTWVYTNITISVIKLKNSGKIEQYLRPTIDKISKKTFRFTIYSIWLNACNAQYRRNHTGNAFKLQWKKLEQGVRRSEKRDCNSTNTDSNEKTQQCRMGFAVNTQHHRSELEEREATNKDTSRYKNKRFFPVRRWPSGLSWRHALKGVVRHLRRKDEVNEEYKHSRMSWIIS